MEVKIRKATEKDAKKIADLACQMGHSMTEAEAKERVTSIDRQKDYNLLFVAEEDSNILGFVSVYITDEILNGPQARIGGLVVDSNARGKGVGRILMTAAEDWAKEKGSQTMKLSSSMERVEAHKFYEKIGYTKSKEQAAFKKTL